MDSIFLLSEGDRAAFLQHLSHSFGCTFICLWSYLPQPSNCLLFMDGIYHEENKQPSSSAGPTRARILFNEYQKSVFVVDNSAPGFAFKNSLPYIELKELELQTLASTKTQLQFYHEARIKTAIFMGCKTGEIELGMSIDTQADFEMKMRNCFAEDFSQQLFIPIQLPQPTDQNPPPSSSSSLRSLSIDSADGTMPDFLFNNNNIISTNSSYPLEPCVRHALVSTTTKPVQTLSQIRNIQFPTLLQSEDDAMTRAILAVISSSSSSPPSSPTNSSQNSSAFKRYRSVLAPTSQITSRVAQKQNMLRRAVAFLRSTSNTLMRNQEQIHGNQPTSNQLHHMISERRRREKLNESFQALRSLLPPGSKKDKASVLSNTKEYVNSLKAEVEELSRKKQILEAQLLLQNDQSTDDNQESALLGGRSSNDQRLDVRITNIIAAETTSEYSRILDLRVAVRGEYCSMLDLAIRVLEFLKLLRNVSLISVEADTWTVLEATSVNRLVFRLKIEGEEWDETTFQEAARRVVADLAQ